jgi:hypothetical protein
MRLLTLTPRTVAIVSHRRERFDGEHPQRNTRGNEHASPP